MGRAQALADHRSVGLKAWFGGGPAIARRARVAWAPSRLRRAVRHRLTPVVAVAVGLFLVVNQPNSTGGAECRDGSVVASPGTAQVEPAAPKPVALMTLTSAGEVLHLESGDLVDVWQVDQMGESSVRVAAAVEVVIVRDRTVSVAVAPAQVDTVVTASVRPWVFVGVGLQPGKRPG